MNYDLISRKEAINIFLNEGMPTAAVYIERMKPAQPKRQMSFSERVKIINEYKEWRNDIQAVYCPESFLAYLCIKGYIDG